MSFSDSFEYKVVFSRRRTLSVRIKDDNSVVVSCPYGTPAARIERFLAEKSRWINNHLVRGRAIADEFSEVFEYKKVLVGGQIYDLELNAKGKISDGKVCAENFAHLKGVYVDALGEEFISRFMAIAARGNFAFSSVRFRNYKGRWGCCDVHNNITFNYKLLMLPQTIQNSVIAHELCHTVYHDHSEKFHKLLDSFMPENRQCSRMLAKYSFIARLY